MIIPADFLELCWNAEQFDIQFVVCGRIFETEFQILGGKTAFPKPARAMKPWGFLKLLVLLEGMHQCISLTMQVNAHVAIVG